MGLLLVFVITITSIMLVVLKDLGWYDISSKGPKLNMIPRFALASFVIFSIYLSFYNFTSLIKSLKMLGIFSMLSFFIKISWSLLIKCKDSLLWFEVWGFISLLTGLIYVFDNKDKAIVNKLVEFGILVVMLLILVTVLSIIVKSNYAQLFIKSLFVSYGINVVLMGFMHPFDIGVALSTWLICLILGAILFKSVTFVSKKRLSPVKDIIGLSDQNEFV